MDRGLCNVLLVSFGFFCLLTSLSVLFNCQKYVLERISADNVHYNVDAYIGLCISFAVYAVSIWVTPLVISQIGTRTTILVGFLLNLLYIVQFLSENEWLYYAGSILNGIGGALCWTAQGHYFAMNSTPETVSRNSGIFWAIFQSSGIIGNLFILFGLENLDLNKQTRNYLFIGMTITASVAVFSVFTFGRSLYRPLKTNARKAFCQSWHVLKTRDMLLLSVTIFHNGLECGLCLAVYGSTLGFTKRLPHKDTTTISLSGMLVAVGEVAGGAMFGIMGRKTIKWGRYPIMILGFVVQTIAFVIIVINLPNASIYGPTYDKGVIEPSETLALICSFLLGMGDSCYATQIYAILGTVFVDKSASAFGVYNFFHGISFSISLAYTYLGLHWVIGILTVTSIIALGFFIWLEISPTYVPSYIPSNLHLTQSEEKDENNSTKT